MRFIVDSLRSPARSASSAAPSRGGRPVDVPRLAAVAGSVRARLVMMGVLASRCPRTIMPTVGKRRPERYDGEVPAVPGQEWQAETLSAQRTGAGSPMRGQSLRDARQSYHRRGFFFNGDGNFGQGLQFGANPRGRSGTGRPAP